MRRNTWKTIRSRPWVLLVPFVLCLSIDYIYSRNIESRLARYETTTERDQNGVREGCEAFSMGNGPVGLMMIHGFADSPALYKRIAPALAAKGFMAKAVRLPGFAESIDRYRSTDLDSWRAHVASELSALSKDCPEVWVVGHSMGGALAMDYARRHPGRVAGLILLAPLVDVSPKRARFVDARTSFEISQAVTVFTDTLQSIYPVDAHDTTVQDSYPRDTFLPTTAYREMFRLMDDLKENPFTNGPPVLVILSPDDHVIDSNAAEEWFNKYDAPKKRLVYQPDAGHVIPWDYGWTNVVEEIVSFISKQEAPRHP